MSDWSAPNAELLIKPDGVAWIRTREQAEVPQDPPPVESLPSERLDLGHQGLASVYLQEDGRLLSDDNTVTAWSMAQFVEACVIRKDQSDYDAAIGWLNDNMARSVTGSGQSSARNLYASHWDDGDGEVTNWIATADSSLKLLGAAIGAWNVWNRNRDRDLAIAIGNDIVASLVSYDEGRANLMADTAQKVDGSGNQWGHHTFNSSLWFKVDLGGWNPVHLRQAKTFFGAAVWDHLLEGLYYCLDRADQGDMDSTTGLPPDWATYNTAGHSLHPISSGNFGWTETLSHNFGKRARRVVQNLEADAEIFGSQRSEQYLEQVLQPFYTAAWTSDAIVTEYERSGTPVGSTEDVVGYWAAIGALTLNDPAHSAAVTMRTLKLPDTMGQHDNDERYVYNQLKGYTPDSILGEDQAVWLAEAIGSGVYIDLTRLGTNPTAGTGSGGGDPTTPPVIVPPDPNPNPPSTGTELLVAESSSLIALWHQSLSAGQKKDLVGYGASRPSGYWVGLNWDPVWSGAANVLAEMAAQDALAMLLTYSIPLRDLGHYSSGGASTDQEYHDHIHVGASVIGDQRVVMVYEPDSLPHLNGLTQTQQSGRLANMRYAIAYFKANCPNLTLLIDIGHPNWLSVSDAVDRLKRAGVEYADGFALNTSNFVDFLTCVNYGDQIVAGLNMPGKGYTIDCARNGNPVPASHWANPPRRRYGMFGQWGGFAPQFPNLYGVSDWKKPGESDGNSGDGAPNAGELWETYIYNDSVGFNINTDQVSTSSGLSQRPPTPGVPAAPPA